MLGSMVVLKHFDKYPLITNKLYDYLLWRQVLMIIDRKEHLTEQGLRRIVAIKAAMNLGLSDKLKEAFLDIVPVKRRTRIIETSDGATSLGKDLLKVYKALLFLGAGAVIHAVADNQDFRRYGGLRPFLPLTYSVMLIASLSLVAFPFMTGFYSKDFILESAYGQYDFSGTVVYIIATIGAMFTTLYSVKVLYLTFLTNPNGPLINYKKAHEGNIFMSLPAG
ncbi:hypothetical protein GMOD_00010331 [Pyrenophora seminiperda CCB06]|uniref:Uncharacterized protein n=1 Tax=Pyrenophora seminiperda CCB06 TaxID=1302712 RepID=A0A3M7M5K0_9PLEO|nr:hypothetical protein GMOD_00010331 [Pyrenophora seminiperda CCB06]